ncbi:MAG TPA: hypothetical protein VF297_03430 [Pyrinomonadaceae bacterium]
MTRNFTLGLLLTLAGTIVASAQDRPESAQTTPATAVTVSVSADGVRFAALGSVKQMRLEVFGPDGAPLYSSDFRPGGVRDWKLDDAHGLRLPDGAYLCVVTYRDVAGRLGVKQGAVLLQGGQAVLQLVGGNEAGAVEAEKRLAPVADNSAAAVTLTTHDGGDGQLVSTRGGLSFRAGDFFAGKDKELMRLTPDGDLGVGVSEPKAKLDVAGTIRARGGIQFDDGTVLTSARRAPVGLGRFSASGPSADANVAVAIGGSGTTNRLAKWVSGEGMLGDSVITESGGNLGVGTTSPSNRLDIVRGNAGLMAKGFYEAGSFEYSGDMKLGVYSSSTNSPNASLTFGSTNLQVNSRFPGFEVQYIYGATSAANLMRFNYIERSASGQVAAAAANVLTVRGDGTVTINPISAGVTATPRLGIGTDTPQATLDVNGNLKVSGSAVVDGNIAAKYQDVAEWVEAREPLAAGTVVILDPTRVNTVMASTRPYDTHVAGVVSAQPGVILGQAGEGKAMVATTGRVKVRVDATRRAIRIGDLLVTSGKTGMAMKSLPVRVGRTRMHRPGTIIGKALEPLAKGKGEILVLLSAQ